MSINNFSFKFQQTFVLVKTYWKRPEDIFSVPFLLSSKTSSRHICKTSWKYVLKTSWGRLGDVFEDILKTSCKRLEGVLKTFLEDVLQTRLEGVLKMSWKTKNCYNEDVFKTSWKTRNVCCDIFLYLEDVLKTPWRPTNICWEGFQRIF